MTRLLLVFAFALCSFATYGNVENLVAKGSEWRYFVAKQGQEVPATGWQLAKFDHRDWLSGRAPLGYGEGDEATHINVMDKKTITQYFVHRFTITDITRLDAPVLHWLADDGVVIYLNGEQLVSSMMPIQFDHNTLATGSLIEYIWQQTSIDLQALGNKLYQGENILAVEVHQISVNSSDLRFDLALVHTPFKQVDNKSYQLVNGQSVNINVAQSQTFSGDHVFDLPIGVRRLTVTSHGGIGDGDLYLAFEQPPRLSQWQWHSASAGNHETITIENPRSGGYVLRVFALRAVAQLSLRLNWQ